MTAPETVRSGTATPQEHMSSLAKEAMRLSQSTPYTAEGLLRGAIELCQVAQWKPATGHPVRLELGAGEEG